MVQPIDQTDHERYNRHIRPRLRYPLGRGQASDSYHQSNGCTSLFAYRAGGLPGSDCRRTNLDTVSAGPIHRYPRWPGQTESGDTVKNGKNKRRTNMKKRCRIISCIFFCAPLSVSRYWESTLPATGKAPFPILGKHLSRHWESLLPNTGKTPFPILGKRLSQ